MRKLLVILCAIVCLSGCSGRSDDEPIELSVNEVNEKLQNEKQNSFLLYLTTNDCYSCEQFEKVITNLEKQEAFEIYYLKVDLNEEDSDVKKAMEELKVTTGSITQLPTTYYFYQGNLLPENKKEGYLEEKDMKAWLKSLHILH